MGVVGDLEDEHRLELSGEEALFLDSASVGDFPSPVVSDRLHPEACADE